MKQNHRFVCPETGEPLRLQITRQDGDDVIEGVLQNRQGRQYPIRAGIPHLVHPPVPHASEAETLSWYEANHTLYDDALPLTFRTFGIDEQAERNRVIDQLVLQPGDKVLETGAGTGRDSQLLAERLGSGGELHVHDLLDKMLLQCVPKLAAAQVPVTTCVSNAIHLPYADRSFDAYYHFGGFNTFSDKKRAFAEISRVVRPGGRVVVGDESMAPWLRDTEFAAILMHSNPHYRFRPPLEDMHVSARDVSVHYIVSGAFYFISYTVGEGAPSANFDLPIPGPRGGTLRTRFHGRLEGISPQAVELAWAARERSGMSMAQWLEDAVRSAASRQLGDPD